MSDFDPNKARAMPMGSAMAIPKRPGLRLHRRTGGEWVWVYRFKSPLDGLMRQYELGAWPAMEYALAVAAWIEQRDERKSGVDLKAKKRAKEAAERAAEAARKAEEAREALTVRVVVDHFLTGYIATECRTDKSRRDARSMLYSRVLPALGDTPAYKITRPDASAFLLAVKAEAPSLARLLRSRLGGAWDYAVDTQLLPADAANPWRGVLAKQLKSKRRRRVLTNSEIATLLPHLRAGGDECDALLVALMTGARSGEVVAMDPFAVDLDRGTWTLHIAERGTGDDEDDDDDDPIVNKTDTQRTLRLPRQVIEILRRRGCSFGKLPQWRLSVFVREQACFGLKRWKPHDLRRSMRTGLAALRVRDEICEAALGHVEGGIRGVYNLHRYEPEVGEALQLWCDHLDALGEPTVIPLRKAS